MKVIVEAVANGYLVTGPTGRYVCLTAAEMLVRVQVELKILDGVESQFKLAEVRDAR